MDDQRSTTDWSGAPTRLDRGPGLPAKPVAPSAFVLRLSSRRPDRRSAAYPPPRRTGGGSWCGGGRQSLRDRRCLSLRRTAGHGASGDADSGRRGSKRHGGHGTEPLENFREVAHRAGQRSGVSLGIRGVVRGERIVEQRRYEKGDDRKPSGSVVDVTSGRGCHSGLSERRHLCRNAHWMVSGVMLNRARGFTSGPE